MDESKKKFLRTRGSSPVSTRIIPMNRLLIPARWPLLLGIGILIGAALWVGGSFLLFQSTPVSVVEAPKRELVLLISRGTTPNEISKSLYEYGIISDARKFFWVGKLEKRWNRIKAGEYRIDSSMAPTQIFQILESGVSITYPVTIQEGDNIFEISKKLSATGLVSKDEILARVRDRKLIAEIAPSGASSLEGYLFPDTYHITRLQTPDDLIRMMTRRFKEIWTSEMDQQAAALGMTKHEVVTLASIIEKETGAANERPRISSVFHNRLKKRMRLQSDPTTIYGIYERYTGNLKTADLRTYTPYNTYSIPALPIGPIGNPGAEALNAALSPDRTDYLFFVSHNDGTHEFTRSYSEHLAAVRKFQLDPNARKGKSWRDLRRVGSRN